MSRENAHRTPPPASGGAGVRVIRRPQRALSPSRLYGALAFALCVAAGGYLVSTWSAPSARSGGSERQLQQSEPSPAIARPSQQPLPSSIAQPAASRPALLASENTFRPDFELRSLEPDDVAAYMRPGDPEPTAAELIDGLNHAGIYSGLGAFTPPGTSPPLQGLAVPDDFALPEGYVRHHQVTDEGEPIEPILMFSPDHEWVGADGERVALPEDLVVPPELAPPGLPIRPIEIPPPGG